MKDYPEDFDHENGFYWCLCGVCGSTFKGHKRRVLCKECLTETDENMQDQKLNEHRQRHIAGLPWYARALVWLRITTIRAERRPLSFAILQRNLNPYNPLTYILIILVIVPGWLVIAAIDFWHMLKDGFTER